ncbi:hypothetical protein [Desulfocurvibacter africanus]|uniref:hypothetical protein n=1 Tax=Desulfocurvibacter africanus TaxID=873 RepID=UPI0003FB3C2B|nr:hypothetical protein [Desulfocurvibacter africanus]
MIKKTDKEVIEFTLTQGADILHGIKQFPNGTITVLISDKLQEVITNYAEFYGVSPEHVAGGMLAVGLIKELEQGLVDYQELKLAEDFMKLMDEEGGRLHQFMRFGDVMDDEQQEESQKQCQEQE